jgi:hypothetical protein
LREERTSFLKKRSKKRLSVSAAAFPEWLSENEQKFFGSFFSKKNCFLYLVAWLILLRSPGVDRVG